MKSPKPLCILKQTVSCLISCALFGGAASAAVIVNPGFDNASPVGAISGTYGQVVSPFTAGFWGAENASIVSTGGTVSPSSTPQMLEMRDDGLSVTQSWQAINVVGMLSSTNPQIGLGALFNVSATSPGTGAAIQLRTFGPFDVWPNHSGIWSANGQLDGDPTTWESISIAPVSVPANTQWVLAEVLYNNTDLRLGGTNGYVDDVLLIVPEPLSAFPFGATTLALLGTWRRRSTRKRRQL